MLAGNEVRKKCEDPAIGNVTATSEGVNAAPASTASLAAGTEEVEPKERNDCTADNSHARPPPRQLLHLERIHVGIGDT